MSNLKIVSAACALAILAAAPAFGHDYTAGSLKIAHPWSRATPKGATVGGGYMTITNNGSAADRLLGGTPDAAKAFEIHKMSMEQGVAKMRPVEGGLEIKPGETVTLDPGGYHVMLVGLKHPLKKGERISATLDFAKAGKVKVEFVVEGMGAMHGGEGGGMPGMTHGH
jgi:copper(I)-binding protein